MPVPPTSPHEASLWSTPIRDLGLTIAGTRLEPILAEFAAELLAAGSRYLRPRFYLSTEWGVPFETVAIAIPFYLAHPDLTAMHAERAGHVEGMGRSDILRYLRHEMGHVVNYAYRLYREEEWARLFGPISLPYREDYRPRPVQPPLCPSPPRLVRPEAPGRGLVRDLCGMDDPRTRLAHRVHRLARGARQAGLLRPPGARTAGAATAGHRPDLDEDVGEIGYSMEEMYGRPQERGPALPPGLDGALRSALALPVERAMDTAVAEVPAAALLRRLEPDLSAAVYQWTGHFPSGRAAWCDT